VFRLRRTGERGAREARRKNLHASPAVAQRSPRATRLHHGVVHRGRRGPRAERPICGHPCLYGATPGDSLLALVESQTRRAGHPPPARVAGRPTRDGLGRRRESRGFAGSRQIQNLRRDWVSRPISAFPARGSATGTYDDAARSPVLCPIKPHSTASHLARRPGGSGVCGSGAMAPAAPIGGREIEGGR